MNYTTSLVLDYTQKSTISTLAVKLSVSAIIYPRWTATDFKTYFSMTQLKYDLGEACMACVF